MSTPSIKQDPDTGSSSQAQTTASVPQAASAAPTPVSVVAAGTPVQTYPSPAHAQWAAQMVNIDPQLQQAGAAAKPLVAQTTLPTTQTPQASQYYAAYSHYPQYYQQYLTNFANQQQQHAQAHAHTSTPVTTRTSFSVAATPAPPTPVTAAHTPAAVHAVSTATAAAPAAATQANQSSNLDTNDIATLNDALGSAGVDLRAEEESLQRHDHQHSHLQSTSSIYLQNRAYEDRSRKQPHKPAFNNANLGTTMRTIGNEHKVTRIPEDSINYMALALKARLQDLIEAMIEASRYRKEAQFDKPANFYETLQPGATQGETPMWSITVRSDVAKQLAVLERVEREDEMRIRKERKERLELQTQHAASLAAQADGSAMMGITNTGATAGMMGAPNGAAAGEDEQPKKKKKKDGPGVTARNLSEDVRKKMSNAVATQAAGLGKYSWMTASAATPAPKKAAAAASTPGTPSGSSGQNGGGSSTWARPYVPKKPQQAQTTATGAEPEETKEDPGKIMVTMRDAMFVIEKERGHGAGRGAARGWR